jgi:hypothetical protein
MATRSNVAAVATVTTATTNGSGSETKQKVTPKVPKDFKLKNKLSLTELDVRGKRVLVRYTSFTPFVAAYIVLYCITKSLYPLNMI